MGNDSINQRYYMNINIIGDSMYLFYLYLTKNIYTTTKASDKKEKKTLIDFWDIHYSFNKLFEYQINEAFKKYNELKKKNDINMKEVLIVHVPNKDSELIDFIFSSMEEELKEPYHMPMILFLVDEGGDGDKKNECKIIPDSEKYPNINKNTIFTEYYINENEYLLNSAQNELKREGYSKMEKIFKVLYRFCSYLNDLGDRFSLGEKDQLINYDLCDQYFPFTINICCIGRFGKGKSTCVNFILEEEKAKESNSGASTTHMINYYQLNNQPIKIYDTPGFESQETIDKVIEKIKELNDEMNELKDNVHVFLYMLDSRESRIFQEMEYNMLKYLSEQTNSKICYVFTHSKKAINKDEKIGMINNSLRAIINKKGRDDFYNSMKADENNIVFINFHQKDEVPAWGFKQLLTKIVEFAKENRTYYKLNKNNLSKEEYKVKIEEEANLRKKKAEKSSLKSFNRFWDYRSYSFC